jgi:hypothetical protein
MEGEEEDEEEEEDPDREPEEFDTELMEKLLMDSYDDQGHKKTRNAAPARLSARCPWPAPINQNKSIEVGRRGRKRRLAVERELETPVQSLFKKVHRESPLSYFSIFVLMSCVIHRRFNSG